MECKIEFIFLSLLPEMITGFLNEGIIKKAIANKLIGVKIIDFREFSLNKHHCVDDTPYGGGSGMLLKPEPIVRAIESLELKPKHKIVIPAPAGKKFEQIMVKEFVQYEQIIFICGRYEGIDERVLKILNAEPFTVGDYILSNGELPALTMFNAISRFVPGVLGNSSSLEEESYEKGILEYPQYTRPVSYRGFGVPEVLRNGNHKEINDWRLRHAIKKTEMFRKDLLIKGGKRCL